MTKGSYGILGGNELLDSGDKLLQSTVQEYYKTSFAVIVILVILVIYMWMAPEAKAESMNPPILYQGSSFGGVLSAGDTKDAFAEKPQPAYSQYEPDKDERAMNYALKSSGTKDYKRESFTTYEPMASTYVDEKQASSSLHGQ